MCIAILTTAHPTYPLILLSNRDEFLSRPTQPAHWWSSNPPVLAGRDLQHPSHGAWLGLTRAGRLAVLTNFREPASSSSSGAVDYPPHATRSRGEITAACLLAPDADPATWAARCAQQQADGKWGDVGGYSLLFGDIARESSGDVRLRLGVLSNRAEGTDAVIALDTAEGSGASTGGLTCSLSNSHFGDRSWPKSVSGEKLLSELATVDGDASVVSGPHDIDELIARCFTILSTDTLPPRAHPGEGLATYGRKYRDSILIPPVETNMAVGAYGTQKQTVVVVDRQGRVTFVERTLFDEKGGRVEVGEGDRRFEWTLAEPCVWVRADAARRE